MKTTLIGMSKLMLLRTEKVGPNIQLKVLQHVEVCMPANEQRGKLVCEKSDVKMYVYV